MLFSSLQLWTKDWICSLNLARWDLHIEVALVFKRAMALFCVALQWEDKEGFISLCGALGEICQLKVGRGSYWKSTWLVWRIWAVALWLQKEFFSRVSHISWLAAAFFWMHAGGLPTVPSSSHSYILAKATKRTLSAFASESSPRRLLSCRDLGSRVSH